MDPSGLVARKSNTSSTGAEPLRKGYNLATKTCRGERKLKLSILSASQESLG